MAVTASLTIVGNLTHNPEVRKTKSGRSVANITIAANPRQFNSETKEWENGEPIFQKCVIWGEAADNLASSLVKGNRVVVVGELKSDSWTDQEGIKRTEAVLHVDEIGASLAFTTLSVGGGGGKSPSGGEDPAVQYDNDTPF